MIVGDSLIFNAQEQIRASLAAANFESVFIGGPGTGLLSEQMRWAQELDAVIGAWHPEVIVLESCCNYGRTDQHPELAYYTADGAMVAPDSQQMFDLWYQAASDITARATASGARVGWVVSVPLASHHPLHSRVDRFNLIVRRVAAEQPGVRLVDWGGVLAASTVGTEAAVIEASAAPDSFGLDGIHLTPRATSLVVTATVAKMTGWVIDQPSSNDTPASTAPATAVPTAPATAVPAGTP